MMGFGRPSITSPEMFGFRAITKIIELPAQVEYEDEPEPEKPRETYKKFNIVHGLTGDPSVDECKKDKKKKVYKPCERLLKKLAREYS